MQHMPNETYLCIIDRRWCTCAQGHRQKAARQHRRLGTGKERGRERVLSKGPKSDQNTQNRWHLIIAADKSDKKEATASEWVDGCDLLLMRLKRERARERWRDRRWLNWKATAWISGAFRLCWPSAFCLPVSNPWYLMQPVWTATLWRPRFNRL